MRRMIITAVASAALVVPGAAVASHQGREDNHGVHHHKRHHRHSHLLRFGTAAGTQAAGPTGATSTAGTIASFTNGTLTITLNDGSTVSGKVTDASEIECRSAIAGAASDGHGDQRDQGDDRGDDGQSNSGPDDDQQGDFSGHDDGDDDAQDEAEHCTSAALVTGAVVREAQLRVSSAGTVWEKVELKQ
jgi:hypothetical protein